MTANRNADLLAARAKLSAATSPLRGPGVGREYMAAASEAFRAGAAGGSIDSAFKMEFAPPYGAAGIRIDLTKAALVSDGSTGNVDGSAAVDSPTVSGVADAVLFAGALSSMCRHSVTNNGRPSKWLRYDDTANVGELLVENATSTAADLVDLHELELKPNRYSSKRFTLSSEFFRDAEFDVGEFVLGIGGRRILRKLEADITNGDGIGDPVKPYGAALAAQAGVVAASQTAVTSAELLGLIGKVDFGYIAGNGAIQPTSSTPSPGVGMVGFQVSQALYESLIASDAEHTNLSFAPSVAGGGLPTWRGWPIAVNENLDALEAGKVPALFGDFGSYVVRTVGEVEVLLWPDHDRNRISCNVFRYSDAGAWRGLNADARVSAGLWKACAKLTMAA